MFKIFIGENIRLILILFFVFCLVDIPANAQKKEPEWMALEVVMLHCIPPIAVGDDVARVAKMAKLPEYPPQKAKLFLRDGGRMFAIPKAMGLVVLQAPRDRSCRVAVRKLDVVKFWQAADQLFAPFTPWKLVSEERKAGTITKIYRADFHGNVMAIVSTHNQPVQNGLQALITIARYKPN